MTINALIKEVTELKSCDCRDCKRNWSKFLIDLRLCEKVSRRKND